MCHTSSVKNTVCILATVPEVSKHTLIMCISVMLLFSGLSHSAMQVYQAGWHDMAHAENRLKKASTTQDPKKKVTSHLFKLTPLCHKSFRFYRHFTCRWGCIGVSDGSCWSLWQVKKSLFMVLNLCVNIVDWEIATHTCLPMQPLIMPQFAA